MAEPNGAVPSRIPPDVLAGCVAAIFRAAGVANQEAEVIGRHLVGANLTGHDSHGIIRVPRYIDYLKRGIVFAGRTLKPLVDGGAYVLVDGERGFGQTLGPAATRLGIERCREHGVAIVALRNSGHLGRIGEFAEMAAAENVVSLHLVTVFGSALVAPFGGADRRFSTNPIAVGIPVEHGDPVILDFATSAVAEGKVLSAFQGGKPLPPGTLVGPAGELSADPLHLYGSVPPGTVPDPRRGPGALRTFGEHKGSGLALVCELLAGALTGTGTNRGEAPLANGMLSIFIDPGRLETGHGFAREVADYVDHLRSSRPADGHDAVLAPGDPERALRKERAANGIPIPGPVLEALRQTAESVGLPGLLDPSVARPGDLA